MARPVQMLFNASKSGLKPDLLLPALKYIQTVLHTHLTEVVPSCFFRFEDRGLAFLFSKRLGPPPVRIGGTLCCRPELPSVEGKPGLQQRVNPTLANTMRTRSGRWDPHTRAVYPPVTQVLTTG